MEEVHAQMPKMQLLAIADAEGVHYREYYNRAELARLINEHRAWMETVGRG